ncbi:hypothetical protein ACQUQU_12855 [Thalassolituus sp. LLYu03]|uniref:hypothetical protein n=1 Tax=Thalassolituus sp. LLYu03 TaxID=3421656 RepID=UPI003D2C8121
MLLLRALLLTLFVGVSLPSLAANTEQSVYDLRTGIQIALLDFYHYQADEGNPQLLSELNQVMTRNDSQRAALRAELPSGFVSQTQSLDNDWQHFAALMNQNVEEIKKSNFPELQVVTMMREVAGRMMDNLDQISQSLRDSGEVSLGEADIWARHQKELLLTITERYLERAASSMGAPLTVSDVTINDLCQQFASGLDRVQEKRLPDTAQAAMGKIRGQWLFISKAANDTESRLVPFLVMRYTNGIITQLNQIAGLS